VRLQPDHAVHDVRARALEQLRALDVRLLVEARAQLDHDRDLLARLRRVAEREHDGILAARGAIQRVLDGEHVRIARRLPDELFDRAAERLVRVMQEHVLAPQHREDVGGAVGLLPAQRVWLHGLLRRELQLGTRQVIELPKRAEVRERVELVLVLAAQLEVLAQQRAHVLRHRALDLEPHRSIQAQAALEALGDRFEQIVGFALVELEVGVERHAERVVLEDAHAGKERVELRADQLLDRQQRLAVPERHEARQRPRHLHARERERRGIRALDPDAEVQRQVRDRGERVRAVDGKRREHRLDVAREVLARNAARRLAEVLPAGDPDAVRNEGRCELPGEHCALPREQLERARPNLRALLRGRAAVEALGGDAGAQLLVQRADAHLEELVQIGADDRRELDALEQRQRRVLGEREHARVEGEP
jgi:hypothetical protein